MDADLGPRFYSNAIRHLHDEEADASPILREFDPIPFDRDDDRTWPERCTGRRRWTDDGERIEPGHPEAVCLGDMAERDAVVLVGEIGGGYRITVVAPGYMTV